MSNSERVYPEAEGPAVAPASDLGVPLVPSGGGAPGTAGGMAAGTDRPGGIGGLAEPVSDVAPSGPPSAAGGPTAEPANETAKTGAHTRASATWTAVAGALLFLIVVLVFLLENLQQVRVTFFGAHWRAPLAVDLLLSVVLGGLIVFCAGAVRIMQVRLQSRRHQRALRARTGMGGGSPHVLAS